MMKHISRYTTLLLRTALLFGAMILINITGQAQPVSLTADMPDAFETMTPVVGDGEYYYIQFYREETYSPYLIQSFLGELGEGVQMQAMDYLPFASNRQWTFIKIDDTEENKYKFKLKSKRGYYAYYSNNRFYTTATEANATVFTYKARGSYRSGFYELLTSGGQQIGRWSGGGEWSPIISVGSNNQIGFVRLAKLKPNAAHIIYYRQEGVDNNNPQASTTRHYLTYSDTDNRSESNFRSSTVSSRRSIIPGDKSLWTLPTAAAYHQDGLWALEETGTDGEFFIKKHGTEEYLNPVYDGFYYLNLGEKDNISGKYTLETPTANRYTRVQNVAQVTEPLTASMFNYWNGYDANATSTGAAYVDSHIGEQITADQATNGYTIIGDGNVSETTYADLNNYSKMIISGTQNMQLRVMMSRQGYSERPWVEKLVTIGSDGTAEVDLKNLELNTSTTGSAAVKATYINGYTNGNHDSYYGEISTGNPVYCGYNKITGGNRVDLYNPDWENDANIAYLQVDASAISGTITKVTLKGDFKKISTNGRQMEYGVGYNSSTWSNQLTWNNADRSITTLGSTQKLASQDGEEELSFDITDAFTSAPSNKIKTILVYNLTAGSGYIRNPRVEVEYYPSVSYAHLNAIKTNWGSPGGTISNITLTKTTGQHLHHAEGDGWQAMLWGEDHTGDWYAGFYPVEVPVSQKDEFFQVRLLVTAYGLTENKQAIYLENMTEGMTRSVKLEDESHNIIGASYTPTEDYQRCFRFENLAVPSGYGKIVIRFAEPVTGNWNINGVVNGQNSAQSYERIPEGSLYYEMDLRLSPTDENPVSSIVDFTIFNWEGERSPISIAEVYFYSGTMVNNETGGGIPSSEGSPSLWQLEQVDNYKQFRLKNPDTGRYLASNGVMTEPNDPNGEAYDGAPKAEISPNNKFWTDFSPKWYIPTKNVDKEIRVNYYVRHKESYLRTYADDQVITDQEGLRKQGLSRDIDSDWRETENKNTKQPYLLDGYIQNTNYFEITHYVKKGSSRVIEFPTVLNKNNDHIYFQRFYHFDEDDTQMDLTKLKAHVSLDTRDDGDVQYFLYNNGMVTGQKLDWRTYDNGTYIAIPNGGMARNEQRRFNFTNSDGESFTVGVDVSRYSDLEYLNTSDHLDGDLKEPSLTMRYLFYMNDAKEMAKKLTACTESSGKWLEKKDFHFGRTQVPYTKFKKVGYRGEFLPIRHVFSDYWVYDDPRLIDESYLASLGLSDEALNEYLDQHLVSAVNDNTSGKIEVEIVPGNTGIRRGGYNANLGESGLRGYGDDDTNENNYQCFYYYDLLSPSVKHEYGNSRFIVFRYPETGIVENCGPNNPAYIRVYLNNNGTKYQIAQYTIYFDANMATRPWTRLNNGTSYANGVNQVKNTDRDPNKLRVKAGKPIAKVTFDFPKKMKISGSEVDATYHYPTTEDCPSTDGKTRHNGGDAAAGGTITLGQEYTGKTEYSSPVPLTFGHTNYAFDGDDCNWGSYALVTGKKTTWGNDKIVLPADDDTYGYKLPADDGMQKAFMYIDASEQPGDICAMEFEGEFCASDKLMCSGWISGSNKIQNDDRCPGSITLTVKGEDADGTTNTIYRFCPGQIYELDNGYGNVGQGDTDVVAENGAGVDGSGNGATHVVWQQFYFEFSTDRKYERYWLEVNNNCVSSNGGDFMLDNVEVYAYVPEVDSEMNTPLCVKRDGNGNVVTEMSLLKLKVDYNKLKSSANISSGTTYLGFVFLEKDVFLRTLKQRKSLSYSLEELAEKIADGTYTIAGSDADYQAAFNAALLRKDEETETIWKSDNSGVNKGSGVLYFKWDTNFESELMPQYSFYKAVNKTSATYRYTDSEGEPFLIMNGNFPELPWKTNTDYYIVPSNDMITSFSEAYSTFNICSDCSKASVFQLDPPYQLLSMEASEATEDLVVCEGKIPTLLTNLKGYDVNGRLIPMTGLNFDWWLGDPGKPKATPVVPPTLATLDNYHSQQKAITVDGVTETVKLDVALSTLRAYYKDATNLDGIIQNLTKTPNLTKAMVVYLQELVDKGQLVLHQKSISIPAEKASDEDPYFYLVACPIHDAAFDQALNPAANEYVSYFCDEPQGLRIKVGEKAPTLKCGFVPGENGFESYSYPADSNPILSIRLAKKQQFKNVQHGTVAEVPPTNPASATSTLHFLWLPIRDAIVQSTGSTDIQKSDDYNIYLASTDDPVWDKEISKKMNTDGELPIFGKIVQLTAINTSGGANTAAQKDNNRLCIYFIEYGTTDAEKEKFEVREGYNYTLSLPFKESPGENTCDGTLLVNLKIVPDYEVWTGAAGNTDWNNDQNWRRADGNTTSTTGMNNNELYVTTSLPETSPLYEYKANAENYRTDKDRVFRKGFAPLYCTHVLLKSDEWGNAPVLYDALDTQSGKDALSASPFPNLRDEDNWDGQNAEATATSILKFDLQARKYDIWTETYPVAPDKGREGDLLAEMYQVNSCDEIAFQPATELRNAHLLNYNNAWVEYQLNMDRWYLLGSPLQGTIAGEWYAPTGTAQQQTTYYEDVTFGTGYDRYSPAFFQRSWDKAKAVLYEVGSDYDTEDNPDDLQLEEGALPGSTQQGGWNETTWNSDDADAYLARLGYKPMDGKKVNVAMKGIWSNTYNDATVDYTKGGFSVMVLNNLKGGSNAKPAIVRLPKEDVSYKYWTIGKDKNGTDTDLTEVQEDLKRALNRGRLKTDSLLPESTRKQEKEASSYKYGDRRTYTRVPTKVGEGYLPMTLRPFTEDVSAGISNMGYYLVENPFPCGMNMDQFFEVNTGLEKKYWLLTADGQHLVQKAASGDWITQSSGNFTTANAVVAPGQGFFVEATTAGEATTITFNKDMQAQSRYGEQDEGTDYEIVVGTKQVMETIQQTADDGTVVDVTVPKTDGDGNYVIEDITEVVTVYNYVQTSETDKQYSLRASKRADDEGAGIMGLVITAQRGDQRSSALVMQRKEANNDFLPSEDTEAFINSDLQNIPTVYTLCGRLATTINSIHDFRCLPLGVESASDASCTLTFRGVETLGDSIAIYDAVEQTLTPLESGAQMTVSGQTQNRYYIVKGLNLREAAEETHLQIFAKGKEITVIASTQEPISSVRCFDTAGRLVYSANPQTAEHHFSLQSAGVYIIDAQTDNDRKTQKVMTK